MQPPGTMFDMPPQEDPRGWQPRPGQEAYAAYIATHPAAWAYPARMPTGYGKTEAILMGYDHLRKAGAHRLLIIVPSQTQETAYANYLQAKAAKMHMALTTVLPAMAGGRAIQYHRQNKAEIFVSTIQRLQSSTTGRHPGGNWILDLLDTGRWVGAADEYHHYATDNTWGATFKSLTQVRQWMALSATPDRKTGNTIFGTPIVNVSYADALKEQEPPVKNVKIKVREYGVDIRMLNGGELRRTTSELRDQIGTDKIDEWEARKQLRYLTKYCSPILVHAVQELEHLNLNAPFGAHPQMLVYAFSCLHAQSLCVLLASHAPGLRVEWVGTGPCGRLDSKNTELTEAFLRGELDILVQVNMASEGFNSVAVCVIVDLALTGFSPQKLQAYGRGTRYYHDLPLTIFVPTDSNVASFASLREGIFDLPVDTVPANVACDCCERCPQCEHHTENPKELPKFEVINAALIGGTDYEPSAETIVGVAHSLNRERDRPLHPAANEEDRLMVQRALTEYYQTMQAAHSEQMQLTTWSVKMRSAVGIVARNVLLIVDGYVEKSRLGDVCRAINTRWKFTHSSHEAMTTEDFEKKWKWLDELNADIMAKRIPRWLA